MLASKASIAGDFFERAGLVPPAKHDLLLKTTASSIGGEQRPAIRIQVDPAKLAARGLKRFIGLG
jgi:hypothetical protein